jgi:predicted DsbA family dithiol-disulfide isomerase
MGRSVWLFITQLWICVALAASAALYVHYLSPLDSGYCGPSSGCEAARRSGLGYFFGSRYVSLPLFSLVAFGALGALSLRRPVPGSRSAGPLGALWREPSLTLFAASGIGAVLGLGLVGYQAVILEQYCWLCMIVDVAALGCAVFAFLAARAVRQTGETPLSPLRTGAWAVVAALLVAGPLVWDAIKPPAPIPGAIAALYQPGKINVVEFADYECPHCRRLHPQLSAVIDSYPGKVNFRRLNLPLKSHEFAHGAARAQVCAREQGKGEAMADRLFAAEDLHPSSNRDLAKALGVELGAYDQCISSGAADKLIEAESKILLDHGLQGLPTTYVGAKTILGAQPEEVFRDAFDRAERGEGDRGIPASVYWPLVLSLAAAICWVGRVRRATL